MFSCPPDGIGICECVICHGIPLCTCGIKNAFWHINMIFDKG